MYIPPQEIRCKVGPFDDSTFYVESALQFFKLLQSFTKITYNESILDLACGCGRSTIPFYIYLNNKGSYDGLDACKELVDWCNLNKESPNFNFTWADVYTPEWNKDSTVLAKDYKFPYKDNSFSLIIAESLFTHLLPESSINYFQECFRILKPKGRLVFSTFIQLIPTDSVEYAVMKFKYPYDNNCFIIDEDYQEAAVCYTNEFFNSTLKSIFNTEPKIIEIGNWRSDIDKEHCGHDHIIIYKG
jgi:SAM-dependent methyltransferase